jgi:hypothetical protein
VSPVGKKNWQFRKSMPGFQISLDDFLENVVLESFGVRDDQNSTLSQEARFEWMRKEAGTNYHFLENLMRQTNELNTYKKANKFLKDLRIRKERSEERQIHLLQQQTDISVILSHLFSFLLFLFIAQLQQNQSSTSGK